MNYRVTVQLAFPSGRAIYKYIDIAPIEKRDDLIREIEYQFDQSTQELVSNFRKIMKAECNK